MTLEAEVTLEGYPNKWQTGAEILDLKVTLGQGEKSSNCAVVLVDPGGKLASQLIEHTLKNGGIIALPDSNDKPPPSPTAGGGAIAPSNFAGNPVKAEEWEQAIIGECIRQGVTDKAQIAYILGTAQHESDHFNTLEEYASGADYEGRDDLGNNQAGDGVRFKGRGLVQVTGRRNYQDWSKRLGVDLIANPKLLQTNKAYALTTLVVGMRDGTFTGAKLGNYVGGGRKDFYAARDVVNGNRDRASDIAAYAEGYLSSGKIERGLAGVSTAAVPEKLGPPVPGQQAQVVAATQAPATPEVIKGSKLICNVLEGSFEFYHQGTEHSLEAGTTTLTGQGLRWVLNRRKRNKAVKEVSLKQLATAIAKAHGVELDWQASHDVNYEYVDQSGISDYQLLLREAEQAGLFVSEENKKLTVKSLREIRDTSYTIELGVNLISAKIKDEALDSSKQDDSSSMGQNEPKVDLDPITGQFVQIKPDIDRVADQSSTGKAAADPKGKLAPGQEAIAQQNKARVKRVKGLPSSFVVPLDADSLEIKPLDAVRTLGLPGVLSRVWLVDSVTHSIADGTTQLNCYSPVEVLDLSPPPAAAQPGQTVALNPGKYIFPVKGFIVTSPRGMRVHPVTGESRMHHGTDVGTPIGTPVVASNDGTVTVASFVDGYGNVVYLKHPDGFETRYAHLDSFSVRTGQVVKQGQEVGKSGNTGVGSGPHLHWEIRDTSGASLDPSAVGLPVKVGANMG
jgi:murein DD-endopeptidase MepM/ murein hydrolase activator NlpD